MYVLWLSTSDEEQDPAEGGRHLDARGQAGGRSLGGVPERVRVLGNTV